MNLIFDGIILVVCILSIVLGAKKGFIKSIMGMLSLVAALFVAYAFSPAVADIIERQPFVHEISESISDTLKSLSENESGSYDLDRLFGDMPDAFQQIIDRYDADANELAQTVPPVANSQESDVEALSRLISRPVVRAISNVLAFLGLFVGSLIVLKLLTWLLDLIFQLPVLKSANTVLGLIFGVISAVLLAWTISTLSLVLIRAMSSVSPDLFSETMVDNTFILKFFRDNNFAGIVQEFLS